MAVRPCIVCGTLVRNHSRCPAHRPQRQHNGWQWAAFRQRILQRDGHACTQCGSTNQLHVHHLVALNAGGQEYDPDNCVSVCRACDPDR
jgi:5-methylcytosine-specific restriction endonuclease McrA